MNNANKILLVIGISLMTIGVAIATVSKPSTYGQGKLFWNGSTYWDLNGEAGIQNGTLENMTWLNTTRLNVTIINSTQFFSNDLYGSNIRVTTKVNTTYINATYTNFSNAVIPTNKPSNPSNGSVYGNATTHALNWYYDGQWYWANGTVT